MTPAPRKRRVIALEELVAVQRHHGEAVGGIHAEPVERT
jgi:hypothetical protein